MLDGLIFAWTGEKCAFKKIHVYFSPKNAKAFLGPAPKKSESVHNRFGFDRLWSDKHPDAKEVHLKKKYYCMSKKKWPILYSSLYKMGHYFLDI